MSEYLNPELDLSMYGDIRTLNLLTNSTIDRYGKHLDYDPIANKLDITYGDSVNQYLVNSHGHRSPEFRSNIDLITAGCSQTFGVGVPAETIWSSVVANRLGLSHANLAIPGWSTQAIVQNIFAYFREYGHPKYVVLLLPSFSRMVMPINRKLTVYRKEFEGPDVYVRNIELYIKPEEAPKYSTKPHQIEEVLSPQLAFYLSIQMINMLSSYCNLADIKLLWGTWSYNLNQLFSSPEEYGLMAKYSEYVDLGRFKGVGEADCHSELRTKYGENFNEGLDVNGQGGHHFGVHHHAHLGETFISRMDT